MPLDMIAEVGAKIALHKDTRAEVRAGGQAELLEANAEEGMREKLGDYVSGLVFSKLDARCSFLVGKVP